jgi:hypothetical protein
MRFFKHDILFTTNALIGGYRVRRTQLSRSFYREYLNECDNIINKLVLDDSELSCIKRIKFLEALQRRIKVLRPYLSEIIDKLYGSRHQVSFHFDSGEFQK